MKRRTIGVLAKEAGVGVETIRFYERVGLLRRPPQPEGGWREYGEESVAAVKYIRLAQRLGFSLGEVKQLGRTLLGGGNFCRDFRSAVQDKLHVTESEIQRLTAVKEELERTLFSCLAKSDEGQCPVMKHFPSAPARRRVTRARR
jgi:MerR family mercuric resistance operon transcriptional regulator